MSSHKPLAALAFAFSACLANADLSGLPAQAADPTQTSVSGVSSGAYMAVQLQVAYSASIIGAGVIAGGPFYCAAGNPFFVRLCMGEVSPSLPGASSSVGTAKGYAISHEIDALGHLRHRRLYFFSGSEDRVVPSVAVDATVEFFRRIGVAETGILYVHDVPAGHAMISPEAKHGCAATESPFVNRCDVDGAPYDQAGALLQHIYGPLIAPSASDPAMPTPFDQRPFASAAAGMAATGYVYVPAACSGVRSHCRVHVALHGCSQDADTVGDAFYRGAGFNRWAAANRVIVLYPQVAKSANNEFGCWDWWGYTGSDYAQKSAPQMTSIMAMVRRLASP